MRIRALTLTAIVSAVIFSPYITTYQHVYAQTAPVALMLSTSDPLVSNILSEVGYSFEVMVDVPSDLSGYNVIIESGSADPSDVIRTYAENGGGYVFMSSAAQTLDLETNSYWLGASSFAYEGAGAYAKVSTNHPLGANLLEDALLMQQAPEESGAISVQLEPEAEELAEYGTGNAFAYNYEFGDGRVYFQASTDHRIAGEAAESSIRELLKAGILWATSESAPEAVNLLPDGTAVTTGNEPPSEYFEHVFADANPQSLQMPLPSGSTKSIFVAVTSNVANATLFFDSGDDEYRYNVLAGTDALITFATELNITDVKLVTDGLLSGGTEGSSTVGYVTIKSPPSCVLPPGANLAGEIPIPANSILLGSAGATVGSILEVSSPAVPVNSMFIGFEESEVIGYAITFQVDGVDYSCPVLPATIEISFDEPASISDLRLENIGPWGTIGYLPPADSENAYAKFIVSKISALPAGFQLQANATAPEGAQSVDFSQGQVGIVPLAKPVTRQVAEIWISAGEGLIEPYLYFRSGNEWYSTQINQDAAGTLITFSDDIDVDEVYGSVDGATQNDQIMIGYIYPIIVDARAGKDQSVQELQAVYLDGSLSAGPSGGLTYSWTQIDGPAVALQGENTATPSFSAPPVGESGSKLSFKLTVTDSNGHRSVDIIVVTVVNDAGSNRPPSIGAIKDAKVSEGSHVVLAASAFDPDGEKLTYSWLQENGPVTTLMGSNTATLSFVAPEVTANVTLSFELTVTDESGNSAKEEVLVVVGNVNEIVRPQTAIFSAGPDRTVTEGSIVVLQGKYEDSSDYNVHWEQLSGVQVTLSRPEALDASFEAPPVSDGEVQELVFRLSLLDFGGLPVQFDDVSIMVNSTPVTGASDEPDSETGPTTFAVSDPGFIVIQRTDIIPPEVIYDLTIRAQDDSKVLGTQPSSGVVGIWLNTTADVSDLKFHFSYAGREYFIDTPVNRVMAYVLDVKVELQEIGLSAISSGDQVVQIGYYYDEVPLALPVFPAGEDPQREPVQVKSPSENSLIGFAARNTIIAGALALGVPAGIAIALKAVSNHRRSSDNRDPAKLLFPKNDPIAGEAEKVRPVIEELERMLGKNLDTAVNASELLGRFGTGSAKNASSNE